VGFAIPSTADDLDSALGTFSDVYATPEPATNSLWAYVPTQSDNTYSGRIKTTSSADTAGTTLLVYISLISLISARARYNL
jgi:hypothetical protein